MQIGNGRKLLLSIFREAICPFCNFRVYDLTNNYPGFSKLGLDMVGMRGMATGNLMPADFLIDENGMVVETYYGEDAGEHIPMERIEFFSVRGMASKN